VAVAACLVNRVRNHFEDANAVQMIDCAGQTAYVRPEYFR
jgi:hypothetical protein